MRGAQLVVSCVLVLSVGFIVRAAETPPAEHVKAMKDMAGAVQAMSKPDATADMELGKKMAATLKDAFTVTEKYWSGKDAEAAKLAQAGFKGAADMYVSAGLNSTEGVEAALKDVTATCQPCHAAHREKAGESFLIK